MKRTLGTLFLLLSLIGCHSPVYIIEPFESWVVDEETGEPIEGANVVATWALFEDAFHGGAKFREMVEMKEAVTDKNGRFAFPGFKFYNPRLHDLMEDPKIIVFKTGYKYVRRSNQCDMGGLGDCRWATRIAVVAGQKVKMKKLDYSLARKTDGPLTGMQRDLYTGLSTEIGYVKESCKTKNVPLFFQSIETEAARLASEGFYGRNGLPTVQGVDRYSSRCEFEKQVLEGQRR